MRDLERELKELIVSALNLEDIAPEDIDSDEALFVEGLGTGLHRWVGTGGRYQKEVQNKGAGIEGRNPGDLRDGAYTREIPREAGIQVMVSKNDIAVVLSKYLQDLFDLPTEKLIPNASLSDDLDLDSIDAVDLVVKLQEYTGRKISPSEFKSVRTIGDVVDKIYAQVNNGRQS